MTDKDSPASNQGIPGAEGFDAAALRATASRLRESETSDRDGIEGPAILLKWGQETGRIVPISTFKYLPQLADTTSEQIGPNLVQDAPQAVALGKISVDLPVPRRIFPPPDEGGEFQQFRIGKPIDGILDLGQTHMEPV